MKISFWISATVFYVVSVTLCNSVQVGTVLFTTTDLVKKCWTECDKSLLKARLIMQDVLPDPDCIDFSNPEAVTILLEYFHACFQIISTSTYGKIQNLMYIALSDAIGGYLRAYMLPFTRKAYYAGQVKYSEAKKLFQLYDDIKVFLKTNGIGWAKPQKLTYRKVYVTPLPITGGALEACQQLFTIEKPGKLHCFKTDYCLKSDDPTYEDVNKNSKEISREENLEVEAKNSKRFSNLNSTFESKQDWRNLSKVKRFVENYEKLNLTNVINNSKDGRKFFRNLMQTMSRNNTQKLKQETEVPEVRKFRSDGKCQNCKPNNCFCRRIIVPLPILDDCESPHSIAVPFKKRPFRNLRTRSSAFVLEYYYVAVIKCFIAKGNTRADIKNFNTKFHSWLISQVYPHLSEEQWYPGFGGVLRVLETIKRFGMDNSVGDPLLQDIGYMFDSGVEFEVAVNKRREKARNADEFEECCTYSKRHVLTAIIIVSLIWIFVFCACAFYFQATRGRDLLYEGCSEAYKFTRQRNRDPAWNEKFINFQFLIQFFKKKGTPECKKEEPENQFIDFTKEICPKSEKKYHAKGCSKKKKETTHMRKKHTISSRNENFSTEKIPELIKHHNTSINAWPCQPCLVPFDKIEVLNFDQQSRGDTKEVQNQIQKHHIQTLWKKASKKFKTSTTLKEGREKISSKRRCKSTVAKTTSEETFEETSSKSYSASLEDETKSLEKASSSCCCSENCHHTYSSTTNTTSTTQNEEKLSSATMEFFEEVISRHKPLKKCSTTQESTEESDSDEEGSSESENNS